MANKADRTIKGIGFLLHDVSRLMRQELNRRAAPIGLTQAQWQVLAYLSQHEGVSQAIVAKYFAIQPITLTRVVDKLEKSGWVERHRNPNDRRAVELYLTKASDDILELMWDVAAETRALAMQGLSAKARDEFVRALTTMKKNLCAPRPVNPDSLKRRNSRAGDARLPA